MWACLSGMLTTCKKGDVMLMKRKEVVLAVLLWLLAPSLAGQNRIEDDTTLKKH